MINNFQNFMNQLNQFRQMFNGDPEQQVQQLLNSGRINQTQYNEAVQKANEIYKMIFGK